MALGFPTPDHFLAAISPRQWREWVAYSAIEPFGPRQTALLTAQLIAAILCPHGIQVDLVDTLERLGFSSHALPVDDEEAVEISARIGRIALPTK